MRRGTEVWVIQVGEVPDPGHGRFGSRGPLLASKPLVIPTILQEEAWLTPDTTVAQVTRRGESRLTLGRGRYCEC